MRHATVGQARPQNRVHLRHVGTPQHEGIGVFQVIVTTHGFIHVEGAHKAHHRRGHAVPGVGIKVVGAEPRLHQLGGGIAFPHRPLSGTEHAHAGDAVGLLQLLFPLLRHDVEGLLPTDRREAAVFIVLAVAHAQQRLCQPVLAVHDFRQEIALDAVQTAIDRRIRVALRGDHAPVLHADQNAAASTTEPAHALVPADFARADSLRLRHRRQGNACCRRRRARGIGFDKVAPSESHGVISFSRLLSKWW